MNLRAISICALGITLLCKTCLAQDYPAKPLRWIVGFPPGGGSDLYARMIAQRMSVSMGQPIVIENRGGAGGLIAAPIAAKAAPDGYTLFACDTGTMVLFPLLYEKLQYAAKDFQPVTLYIKSPQILVVHPSLPARNLKELVGYARANPGKISYASLGAGTIFHLAMEMFKVRTGTQMVHVPYKGSAQAVQDLVAGEVKAAFLGYSNAGPVVKAGKLRALGISTKERVDLLPDVPTIHEALVAEFEAYPFLGAAVPAATPRAIVSRLSREIRAAMSNPELRKNFISGGVIPQAGTVEEFEEVIKRDTAEFRALVKSLDLKLEL